jgi:hypothetical protein
LFNKKEKIKKIKKKLSNKREEIKTVEKDDENNQTKHNSIFTL